MDGQTLFSSSSDLVPKENQKAYYKPDKTFGVAVSGDVIVTGLEVRIIDTLEFQRLRKIKQLGTTDLVYPSAHHNRFEHSLGVLKKATLIMDSIRRNQKNKDEEKTITQESETIVRLIALLHDIGHMPYGHTIEDEFLIYPSHDKHLGRWQYFLGPDSTIGRIIIEEAGQSIYERFYRLIKCEKEFDGFEEDAFLYDIVSNTVCADLLDYLERDCLYTGLKLDYHPRFLDYFFITSDLYKNKTAQRIAIRAYKTGTKAIRRDLLSELIQLLRNRYYLGERVYYHHAKLKTGTLLAGAIYRAKKADIFKELAPGIGKIDNKDASHPVMDFHLMGDEQLIRHIIDFREKSNKSNQLASAKRLLELFEKRTVYEEILFENLKTLRIDYEKDVDPLFDKSKTPSINRTATFLWETFMSENAAEERWKIEEKLSDLVPEIKSGDALIYCPGFKMSMKLARTKIAFIWEGNSVIRELKDYPEDVFSEECAEIIRKHHALWAIRVFVNPEAFMKRTEGTNKKSRDEELVKLVKSYFRAELFPYAESTTGMSEFLDNKREFISGLVERYRYSLVHNEGYKAGLSENYEITTKAIHSLVDELVVSNYMIFNKENIVESLKQKLKMTKS